MNLARWIIADALLLLMLSSIVFAECANGTLAAAGSQAATPNRAALAFSYPEGMKTYVSMMGTFLIPQASGGAEIRRCDRRTTRRRCLFSARAGQSRSRGALAGGN